MEKLLLNPRDTIFTLDINLVNYFYNHWNHLVEDYKKRDNLEQFQSIIDFSKSDVKRMYIVGNDIKIKAFKSSLNEPTVEESPTLETRNRSNIFFLILSDNYHGNKSYPTKLRAGKLVILNYKKLIDQPDKIDGHMRTWSASFSTNNITEENKRLSEISNEKCIPIFDIETLENNFENISLISFGGQLKKDQALRPSDFFQFFNKCSKFFIVYDRYMFNHSIRSVSTLFGFMKKQYSIDSNELEKEEKLINSIIESEEKFTINSSEGSESYIIKKLFNDTNHTISFFLRGIDSIESKPKNCFLIAGNIGAENSGKVELDSYFEAIDIRIKEISDPDNGELKAELNDLELIKSFKESFLVLPKGELIKPNDSLVNYDKIDKETKQKLTDANIRTVKDYIKEFEDILHKPHREIEAKDIKLLGSEDIRLLSEKLNLSYREVSKINKAIIHSYNVEGKKTGCGHNRLIFNDYALAEWGQGKAVFSRYAYNADHWYCKSQQNIADSTLFNVKYKKMNYSKETGSGSYDHKYQGLKDFCEDFQDTMIPKATV